MPPPRKPSRVDTITFPVFAICWFGTPSLPPSDAGGTSIVAYCGGGGSAKTGVFNTLAIVVREQVAPDDPGGEGGDGVVERRIKIDTGAQIGVGVAMHRHHSGRGDVRMLVCVGDEVRMYAVPLEGTRMELPDDEGDDAGPALLLGGVKVGDGYGCNAAAFSPMGDAMAVGCENGRVVVFRILQNAGPGAANGSSGGKTTFSFPRVAECEGHDDSSAVSSVSFHPRGPAVLSAGKDGTARLWDTRTGAELGRLECKIEDTDPKKRKAAEARAQAQQRRGRGRGRQAGPPKVLVRGCAFGDLEGKVVYTVQSGKRTSAYLSRWVLVPSPPKPFEPGAPPPPPPAAFREDVRVECSPKPVSAVSLSGDASALVMGNVEGTVYLYDLHTMSVAKQFVEVHDLPVTCVAARPVPSQLSLPGDAVEGVRYDAVTASADNKMGFLTTQRRSTKRKKKAAKKSGEGMSFTGWLMTVYFFMLTYMIGKMSWRLCRPEIRALAWNMRDYPAEQFELTAQCVWEKVVWAPETRPGIGVPPH